MEKWSRNYVNLKILQKSLKYMTKRKGFSVSVRVKKTQIILEGRVR